MTIGIGLLCSDGVVLCSDRQITNSNGSKYEEEKIFCSQQSDWSMVFCYAGFPDSAKVMYHKVRDAAPGIVDEANKRTRVAWDGAKAILAKTYKDPQAKNLWTLIGMRIAGHPPFLLKTAGSTVIQAHTEYIGVGDSSAIRYASDFLIPETRLLTTHQAECLGTYLIFVANRYVDGCSGGPDWGVVRTDGMVGKGSGGVFPNFPERCLYSEEQIGRAMRQMIWAGGTLECTTQAISQK